ncbi:MAG: type II secretion system F family protein [Deltaproteobacteria bacterium]|nr:type II secretion system F family protein [Deltaproteobacteria bacterium]
MIRNFLVRYYTPEGYSLIRNIRGEGVQSVREGLMQDGCMPLFIIPNIFLDIFRPLQNAGMRDKELSVFFIELYQLTQSAGSVGKAFNYMNKEAKKPVYDGEHILIYGLKRLYRNHRQTKLKNKNKLVKDFVFLLDKGRSVKEIFALNHFEEIVLSLVDLAASTGDYPQIFLKISGFFETKDTYKKNVIGAIAYPAFLFFLLFVAFAVFLYYIIPTFASFFGQFPHVPLSTKETLNLFIYVKSIFMYIALFLGITIFLFLSNLLNR